MLQAAAELCARAACRPFCAPANSLVLTFFFATPNRTAPTAVNATELPGPGQGDDIEARLTGAADPNSVPVDDAGQPLDATIQGPVRRLLRGRAGGFGGFSGGSKPSSGFSGARLAPAQTRPYFPTGGVSRPRYATPRAAVGALPFSSRERSFLNSRYSYGRPVYGLGRPFLFPFLPFYLFFPAGYGHAAKCQVPRAADVDGAMRNATVQAVPQPADGSQLLVVTLPAFNRSAVYSAVVALADDESTVDAVVQEAVARVLAYDTSAAHSCGERAVVLAALAAVSCAAVWW
jgi:hypothetical protein